MTIGAEPVAFILPVEIRDVEGPSGIARHNTVRLSLNIGHDRRTGEIIAD